MYDWRRLSPEDQAVLLDWRKRRNRPWHSPPHFVKGPACFHITASCYQHASFIGSTARRMKDFCEQLVATLNDAETTLHAWCVLPNHYHLLLHVPDLKPALGALGKLHGRTSFLWNGEESNRGRKVWCAPTDRLIRSEAHFWCTVNYIHHNPVKHGYVARWQDWPFSSAADFLASVGREKAAAIWKAYPILEYGKGWDDF